MVALGFGLEFTLISASSLSEHFGIERSLRSLSLTMAFSISYHHDQGRFTDRVYRALACFMTRLLPRSRKRFILLSALAPLVIGENAREESSRAILNAATELCRSEEAMLLPILFHELIFTTEQIASIRHIVDSRNLATRLECDEAATWIYKVVPSWLMYEKPKDVVSDLSTLLALRAMLK